MKAAKVVLTKSATSPIRWQEARPGLSMCDPGCESYWSKVYGQGGAIGWIWRCRCWRDLKKGTCQ